MKIALSWLFDHIDEDWKSVNINHLIQKFNETTAEIEGYTHVTFDPRVVTAVQAQEIDSTNVRVFSPEWHQTYQLPLRSDFHVGGWYIVITASPDSDIADTMARARWAKNSDFHSVKEGLLPAVFIDESQVPGSWKKDIPVKDYILDIDNKSITHRADLWGHYGMAREIAALLNVPFKAHQDEPLPVIQADRSVSQSAKTPFALSLEHQTGCSFFATLSCDHVKNKPSSIGMAARLLKVDGKAINFLVDATNYIMFDIGQPMHVFDAQHIPSKTLKVRGAIEKEKLALLDGSTIELTARDLVVADDTQPLALAGIMGGASTAVSPETTTIVVEAACFDASMIRTSALAHKVRTEASARFEKTLDPYNALQALQCFYALLCKEDVTLACQGITAVGILPLPRKISVSHIFLQDKLGIHLEVSSVENILNTLGFNVSFMDGKYVITVPTWRSSKDITTPEDIVEEVGRFVGYSTITPHLPYKPTNPTNLNPVFVQRAIKRFLAYGHAMHELSTYALFDEQYLQEIGWNPEHTIGVKNPVSENWRRLVTSLVPHVLKAIQHNHVHHESLRFFEWGRIWQTQPVLQEQKSLAGIFFEKKKNVDFYTMKTMLCDLFESISLEVVWTKPQNTLSAWYNPHQTACLMHQKAVIGFAGMMDQPFLERCAQGRAFVFEFDAGFLESFVPQVDQFSPLAKYPAVVRDISVLMPLEYTVDALAQAISHCDDAIVRVDLIDFFEKAEWQGQRSLTFRFVLRDDTKTLTKQEVDAVYDKVAELLVARGAQVR